jgi:hypothetical protein
MKITAYNQHTLAPFARALGPNATTVYRAPGAVVVMESRSAAKPFAMRKSNSGAGDLLFFAAR